MRIGALDTAERVVIVAEIGNNHEGDLSVARELVAAAADAGADAVKLQTFVTEHFVGRDQTERFERLERFRLAPQDFAELAELAHARGLAFLSTPLDLGSADLLDPLVDAFKIASGDNDFWPLIERVSRSGKPIVVSAGLADASAIAQVAEFVRATPGFGGDLAVLHCVSLYPVPPEHADLPAILTLRERLSCEVGYSDHTVGTEASLIAVALGARIVEKHFTLDKAFSEFRDHQLSADPPELRALVEAVRRAELLLRPAGPAGPEPEREATASMRRSVAAARELEQGRRLELDDLTWVRPGGGIAPGDEAVLLGKVLRRPVRTGERLAEHDVE